MPRFIHICIRQAQLLSLIMFRISVFFLLMCLTFAVRAQLDSLETILRSPDLSVEKRADVLIQLCDMSIDIDPARGVGYAEQLRELGALVASDELIGLSWHYMGYHFIYQGHEYDSAGVACFRKALPFLEKSSRWLETGKTYSNLAFNSRNSFQYWQAILLYDRSLNYFILAGDSLRLLRANNGIGDCFSQLELYDEALKRHFYNLEIAIRIGDEAEHARSLGLIAHDYQQIGQFDKAIAYYESANVILSKLQNEKSIADNLMQLGNTCSKAGYDDRVLAFYEASRNIYLKLELMNDIISVDYNEAVFRFGRGEYSYPSRLYQKAMTFYKEISAFKQLGAVHNAIGDLYAQMPDSARISENIGYAEVMKRAESNYLLALKYAEENGFGKEIQNAFQALAVYYDHTGQYRLALQNYKKYIQLEDSLYSVTAHDAMLRNEYTYLQRRKEEDARQVREKEIAQTTAEINNQRAQRNTFAVFGGLVVMASAGGYFLIKRRRNAEREKAEAEYSLSLKETEMKALRAQMNPHFIFNSLNSISRFITSNELHEADRYLTRFARLMRLVLENSEHRSVPLKTDLQALELYLQLEIRRLGKPVNYTIRVDAEIDVEEVQIPPLILQPFVENSIWHGMSDIVEEGLIEIEIKTNGDLMHCLIRDNGKGLSNQRPAEKGHQSMGMKITEARLEHLSTSGKGTSSVKVTPLERGVQVDVYLPLETSF